MKELLELLQNWKCTPEADSLYEEDGEELKIANDEKLLSQLRLHIRSFVLVVGGGVGRGDGVVGVDVGAGVVGVDDGVEAVKMTGRRSVMVAKSVILVWNAANEERSRQRQT